MHTRKVVIVGAGRVGSHCALCLMFRHLVNQIVLIDVNREAAEAQAMDLQDLASGLGESFEIRAGDYADCADAHFVIMTAGRSRKPGQTRLEMLGATMQVLDGIVPQIRDSGFQGILISVSNPSDIVAEYLYRTMKLPRGHVFGTGTALDSARLRGIIGREIGVDSRQVNAFCMGEHGDSSFIPWSIANISNVPLADCENLILNSEGLYPELNYADLEDYVRKSGARVIERKGATFYAISISVSHIVKCLLSGIDTTMTVSTMMHGEYGIDDVCLSVLAIVGSEGAHGKILTPLNDDEVAKLRHSADCLKEIIKQVNI